MGCSHAARKILAVYGTTKFTSVLQGADFFTIENFGLPSNIVLGNGFGFVSKTAETSHGIAGKLGVSAYARGEQDEGGRARRMNTANRINLYWSAPRRRI